MPVVADAFAVRGWHVDGADGEIHFRKVRVLVLRGAMEPSIRQLSDRYSAPYSRIPRRPRVRHPFGEGRKA